MNESGRILLLIGLPCYLLYQMAEDWSKSAPNPSKKLARELALWGVCLVIVGAGFTNLGKPLVEQIAAEVIFAVIVFPVGYVAGWIFTKL